MLQASELSYGYSSGRRDVRSFTLDHVSVSVERGSLTGLLGPNGCGKTTLLKLLSSVLQPEQGHVSLNGNSLAGRSRRDIAKHLAVVPQETHPAFDYTVMEMVLMGRHPHLGAFELEGPRDLALAQDALAATGTDHLAARAYMTLSGGEKQRVVIASALTQSPDVLLLDEPTASLDPDTADWVRTRLERYRHDHGATVLLASHNMAEVERLCERVIIMKRGTIEDDDTPAHLLARYGRENLEEVFLDVARGRGEAAKEAPQ